VFNHFAFGNPFRLMMAAPCQLVLARGGRSRLVPPEWYAQAAAKLPGGAELDEVPDADHHVMVDQPLAFAELLRRHAPSAAAEDTVCGDVARGRPVAAGAGLVSDGAA
jgi:pimeloyl-ACP methyl ester carboxylesterase